MNVGEWSWKRARLWPERLFLRQGDWSCTNREFNERVNRMANVLLARGVKKGDRVAVLMVNCSAFLEVFFACAKTGAVIVPVNHHLAVPELARIVADCRPRVLIHSPGIAAAMEDLRHGGAPVECYLSHAGEALAAIRDAGTAVRQGFPTPMNPNGWRWRWPNWTAPPGEPCL